MSQISGQLASSLMPPMALTPKDSFLLLPREISLQDGKTHKFSETDLMQLVSFFKSLHRPLAIDYEHQSMATLPGFEQYSSPDGTAPAAGWIGDVQIVPEGIMAMKAQWTPRATEMLANGEYRYFSPVVFWRGKTWAGKPMALGPVALTNDPEMNGLQAVAARCSHAQLLSLMKESTMDWKKIIAEMMGLDANAPDDQFATACKAKWAEVGTSVTASKKVPTLETEISGLKGQLSAAQTAAGEVTALKATHGTEVAALKATHAGEITALKGAHETAMTGLRGELAEMIVDGLEQTGKIAPADKAVVLEKAKADPKFVVTAFKAVKVGAVVPVGKLGITQGGGNTVFRSPNDHVSASKALHDAPDDRKQLHELACKFADEHKVSYTDAVIAVGATLAAN